MHTLRLKINQTSVKTKMEEVRIEFVKEGAVKKRALDIVTEAC